MKNENYISIQGWMVNKLKLTGNDLICYALIYGFTQNGEYWEKSVKYISDWLGVSSRSAVDILKRLIDKRLLDRQDYVVNGVKFCKYRAIVPNFIGYEDSSDGGYEDSSLHINNNKEKSNKEKEIDKSISKKKGSNAFDVREDLSYVTEAYADIWKEWLDYKDEIKKQYKTQRGARLQYASLVRYANNNPILANAIVKNSIEHSWDGIFAITDKQREFFLSPKSPYAFSDSEKQKVQSIVNGEQPTTQYTDEPVIINGTLYR